MNVPGPTRSDADGNHSQSRGTHARIRLTSGLLGLSSAAILSVYGLGYLNTSTASGSNLADIAATPAPHASTVSRPGSTPTPQAQVGYKDGTYVGRGTSRHGDIEATVVIQNGQIVSADISQCMTRYPCSDVAPLVDEVVRIQAAPVHHVSGASDSSRAYKQAVANALSQAG